MPSIKQIESLAATPVEKVACTPEEEAWSVFEFYAKCAIRLKLKRVRSVCEAIQTFGECTAGRVPKCYSLNEYNSNTRWDYVRRQLIAAYASGLPQNPFMQRALASCSVEQLGGYWQLGVARDGLTNEEKQAAVDEVRFFVKVSD